MRVCGRVGRCVVGALLMLAAGCQSFDIVQRNVFSDEDGNLVEVAYGHSDTDHVNTFRSPVNGAEMEFKSRLVVRVTLPDDSSFTAWRCMNFQPTGTMYRTDNEEWMTQVNGFSCLVYRRQDDGRYLEVYRGVLCDTPKMDVTRDTRWKTVKPQQKNYTK